MPLLPHQQLLLPQKPFLVGATTQTSSGTPITLTLPRREAGIGLIAFIARHAGGSATPATPSGWSSLGTSTVDPEYRVAWKLCDGSEAPTTTSAATSATNMTAIVLAFSHFNLFTTPTLSAGSTGTSTVPDSVSVTPGSGFTGGQFLYGAWAMWNGDAEVSIYPARYTVAPTTVRNGTGGGQAIVLRYGNVTSENPGFFTLSASVLWGARTAMFPGFV